MRGEITVKILEAIGSAAVDFGDLLDAVLSAGYGASVSRMDYELSKIKRRRSRIENNISSYQRERQKYYMMLSKLKKEGLVKEAFRQKKKLLTVTDKGREKLKNLKNSIEARLPKNYPIESGNKIIVVAFDIPERDKKRRNWLREILKTLNFSMVQKSVWIGKTKIPQELLGDLLKFHLMECVEIFEINKTGSLRHIV